MFISITLTAATTYTEDGDITRQHQKVDDRTAVPPKSIFALQGNCIMIIPVVYLDYHDWFHISHKRISSFFDPMM
jgi:hypothetical protein